MGCVGIASGPLAKEDEEDIADEASHGEESTKDDAGPPNVVTTPSRRDSGMLLPDGPQNAEDSPDGRSELDAMPLPPPRGLVPMFVAAGQGGRTVTSCTDGRTWIANDILNSSSDDHSPYAGKGLAAGGGMFMALLGWGSPSSVKVSRDGVNWRRINLGLQAGGIGFVNDGFVVPFEGGSLRSSDGGATWADGRGPRHRCRIAEGMGAAMGSGGDDDTKPYATFDGGSTWLVMQGCPNMGFGGIGQTGGFAAGPQSLVAASKTGSICVVRAGSSAAIVRNTGEELGKPLYANGRFWIPGGDGMWVSDDGVAFERRATSPSRLGLVALAYNPHTQTFVGVTRSTFHRSKDGLNWQAVAGSSGPDLQRVVFGLAAPSKDCPVASAQGAH